MTQTTTLPDDEPMADAPRRRRLPPLRSFRVVWPLLALGLLLAFNGVFTAGFFHVGTADGRLYGTPVDVLHYAAPIVVLALGMTLVIATGGVDLSVGATMAIAGTVAAACVRGPVDSGGLPTGHGLPVFVAVVAAVAAALACGAWNGLLVAVFNIQPIVATLILMIGGRGIAELVSSGQPITLTQFGTPLAWLHYVVGGGGWVSRRLLYPVPLDVLWATLAILIVAVLTRRTALGLFLESVGNNAVASRYAGVNATLVKFVAYVTCGVTAGLAGLLVVGDQNSAALGLGNAKELDAILAVSLGGTALAGGRFSLAGSVVGAVIIGTLFQTVALTRIAGRQIPNEWFAVAEAIVILVVCLLQSDVLRARISGLVKRR